MLRLAEKAFCAGEHPVPGHARRHRPQLPRGARLPGPAGRRARGAARRGLASRTPSTRAGRRGAGRRQPEPAADHDPARRASRSTGSTRVFGGARRDEEKARAKERVFSFRDEFGQWDPKNQRPELWSLYNGRIHKGEHIRVFPLSNWTELDVWQYIAARGHRDPVDLLRPRARGVRARRHAAAVNDVRAAERRRGGRSRRGPLPHRRRRDLHRRRGVRRATRSTR